MDATGGRPKTFAVTALDTWRRWKEDDGDEHHAAPTIADLRERLLGRGQTENMLAGIGGHKVLEELANGNDSSVIPELPRVGSFLDLVAMMDRLDGERDEHERLGYVAGDEPPVDTLEDGMYTRVDVEQNDGTTREVTLRWEIQANEGLLILPVRESKVELEFSTSLGPVLARGRVDGGDGLEVLDFKFTGRPDLEELERSWQWRLYLLATAATRFRWEVFTVRPPLRGEEAWRIVERQTYTQFGYPGMRAEVERAVEEFVRLVDVHIPEYWDRARRAGDAPIEGE